MQTYMKSQGGLIYGDCQKKFLKLVSSFPQFPVIKHMYLSTSAGKDGANTEEVAGELKEDGKKSKEDGGESEEDGKKSEEDGKESEEDGGESKEDGGESEEDGKESKKDGGELEKVEKKMPNLKLTDD